MSQVGDWAPVLLSNTPASRSQGHGAGTHWKEACSEVVLGLHVEVVHAATGSVANPQQKVIGEGSAGSGASE